MAKHESITRASLRSAMEQRYAELYTSDQYNGQYAGEFGVLESVLCDSITDDSDSMDGDQRGENFATSPSEGIHMASQGGARM